MLFKVKVFTGVAMLPDKLFQGFFDIWSVLAVLFSRLSQKEAELDNFTIINYLSSTIQSRLPIWDTNKESIQI